MLTKCLLYAEEERWQHVLVLAVGKDVVRLIEEVDD